ncbi:MAG: hypothetical protein AAF664_13310 [Planctomycetota bacterium]
MPTTHNLDDFIEHLPADHDFEMIDLEQELALLMARWNRDTFVDFPSFMDFYFCFSTVLQAYICNPTGANLTTWFSPDEDCNRRSREFLSMNPPASADVAAWMSTHYPKLSKTWLENGSEGLLISTATGTWPEMTGYDSHGFYAVFTSDLVY